MITRDRLAINNVVTSLKRPMDLHINVHVTLIECYVLNVRSTLTELNVMSTYVHSGKSLKSNVGHIMFLLALSGLEFVCNTTQRLFTVIYS